MEEETHFPNHRKGYVSLNPRDPITFQEWYWNLSVIGHPNHSLTIWLDASGLSCTWVFFVNSPKSYCWEYSHRFQHLWRHVGAQQHAISLSFLFLYFGQISLKGWKVGPLPVVNGVIIIIPQKMAKKHMDFPGLLFHPTYRTSNPSYNWFLGSTFWGKKCSESRPILRPSWISSDCGFLRVMLGNCWSRTVRIIY